MVLLKDIFFSHNHTHQEKNTRNKKAQNFSCKYLKEKFGAFIGSQYVCGIAFYFDCKMFDDNVFIKIGHYVLFRNVAGGFQ